MPGAQVDVTFRGQTLLGQVRQVQEFQARNALLQANPAPSLCLARLGLFPDHLLTRWLREGVSAHAHSEQVAHVRTLSHPHRELHESSTAQYSSTFHAPWTCAPT